MSFTALHPNELEWITRPHEPGEPARHVAELGDRVGQAHSRANLCAMSPEPKGKTMHLPGTPLQTADHGAEDLLVYVYGMPPEDENAELLEPVA